MKLKPIPEIKTRGEAIGLAVEFQNSISEKSLSYGEISVASSYFEILGSKFGLTEEFRENGII